MRKGTFRDSKIYKIVCKQSGKIYIGSTRYKLSDRLHNHIYDAKRRDDLTSSEIIKGGNYEIQLIEDYPCLDNKELCEREQYWIETLECVNKNRASRDKYAYDKKHKQDNKDWYNFKRRQDRLWGDSLWRIEI